jgi:trehalose 6-phosphate phosphatase
VREAKASVELLPPGAPDKGSVVRRVAGSMSCVAYAGDDLGDLPAFDALDELAARGARAIRIVVGGAETPEELLSRADLVCRDPFELRDLLGELANRLEQLAGGGAGRT